MTNPLFRLSYPAAAPAAGAPAAAPPSGAAAGGTGPAPRVKRRRDDAVDAAAGSATRPRATPFSVAASVPVPAAAAASASASAPAKRGTKRNISVPGEDARKFRVIAPEESPGSAAPASGEVEVELAIRLLRALGVSLPSGDTAIASWEAKTG